MAQFKDIFTELRRDTGLSQENFAALFHQSGSTISSYETGRNQPSFDMLIQYADYFNVTTDYLLGRVPFDMSTSVFTDSFIDNVTIQDVNAKCAPLSGNSRCEASPSPMMLEAAAPACALCALMSLICATKPSA